MSLRIKHLNADTSFLLIFAPPLDAAQNDRQGTFPGSYTILVDPWLAGASTVFHRRFAHTERPTAACVESLQDLPEPDVILVSQDKSDHCHRETLCTLSPSAKTLVLAVPAAAKKIKSWRHFAPSQVQALTRYDARNPDSVYRIPIPAFSCVGEPGEVTVSFMAPKLDVTGLHQAIGVTYRPPSSPLSTTVKAPLVDIRLPTPPLTPPELYFDGRPSTSSSPSRRRKASCASSDLSPPSTPLFPFGRGSSLRSCASLANISYPISTAHRQREKAISVLYSPHGLVYEHIKPWASRHLVDQGALPLTALFHGLEHSSNPWYLGGNVLAGAENGIHVATELNARVWFVAHDEEKTSTGFSVKTLKSRRFSFAEVERDLAARMGSKPLLSTELLDLGSGEEHWMPAT